MTDRQEPGRAPMREERKERCPRCLLRGGYKYYPGSQAGFEPAESACHICGLNWQEGKGCMLERQAVDFYHATYSDDWADTWRGYFKMLWLDPWLSLLAWINQRRLAKAAKAAQEAHGE